MIVFAVVATMSMSAQAQAPANWSCDDALYADGTCDCGCGALDEPDCGQSREFTNCVRSGCAAGQAPWEHENFSCMASTCGDGWRAEDEACDDKDALDGGGCSADCNAVEDGFACGIGAQGCAPDDGDPPASEGEGEGEGEGDDGGGDQGCNATGMSSSGAVLAAWLLIRRNRNGRNERNAGAHPKRATVPRSH